MLEISHLQEKEKKVSRCVCCVSAGVDVKTERTHFLYGSWQEEQIGDNVVGSVKVILTVNVCNEVSEAWSSTTKANPFKRCNWPEM